MRRSHPGRMMGTSERQLFRARFAWLCQSLLSDVCGGDDQPTVTVVSARIFFVFLHLSSFFFMFFLFHFVFFLFSFSFFFFFFLSGAQNLIFFWASIS